VTPRPLETERLILREWRADDFEAFAGMMADPKVMQFLAGDGKPLSRSVAWRAFTDMVGHWTLRGFGMFAVIEKASGLLVGRAGPWEPKVHPISNSGHPCGLESPHMNGAAHWRAAALINELGLKPHPEGGHYVETFRSDMRVALTDGRVERRALTTIYYLLPGIDVSRWHQVRSDEIWHFCEGAPLELFLLSADGRDSRTSMLGTLTDGHEPMTVVRAGEWQAARSTGDYTLVACAVAPGFEFADFQLARNVQPIVAAIVEHHPALASLL
jgi:uncharacterized protein